MSTPPTLQARLCCGIRGKCESVLYGDAATECRDPCDVPGPDPCWIYLQSTLGASLGWPPIISSREMQHALSAARTLLHRSITCEERRQQGDEDVCTCWVQATVASDRVRAVDLPGVRLPHAGPAQLADLSGAWQSFHVKKRRKRRMRLSLLLSGYRFPGIRVWGLACVAAAHLAIADPATETSSA
jgi:hypothetical protein